MTRKQQNKVKALKKLPIKQDSAIFTHIHTNTGRAFVKPIRNGERISIDYKRSEVVSLKATVFDSRIMMQQHPKVKSKLLKRQIILQNIYLN